MREVVLDDAEARRFDLEGLIPFTRYSVSVQVINPEGVGPTATCTVSTDEGGGGRPVTIPLPALQLIFFCFGLDFLSNRWPSWRHLVLFRAPSSIIGARSPKKHQMAPRWPQESGNGGTGGQIINILIRKCGEGILSG